MNENFTCNLNSNLGLNIFCVGYSSNVYQNFTVERLTGLMIKVNDRISFQVIFLEINVVDENQTPL